jgi:phospholipid/cholesterol/gamma-HCH transport system ATP-binding protein
VSADLEMHSPEDLANIEDPECVIEVEHVFTQLGTQVIHKDVSMEVHRGEVMALVGGSGSGKTTLLRHVIGLTQPTRGVIKLFGQSLAGLDREAQHRLRQRFGTLFQYGALFSALPVFDNIALPLRELGILDEDLIHDLVMMKLNLVELETAHAKKMPAQLSGGMIKRVGLARSLALEPELLVLDEPTAGLDPDRSESFVKLVKTLGRELGLTAIMVTHDLDTLFTLADRVAVLAEQRIIAIGTVDEIAAIPHPFIRNFFQGERAERARKMAAAHVHK